MQGDFQEDVRHADLPRYKEAVMSALFGEIVGWLKAHGLTAGKEFATADKPILQCSQKVIWIDGVSPSRQIVWALSSIRMEVEYGVTDKTTTPKQVLHREKLENLRYNVSTGTEVALSDGSRERFDTMFVNFARRFRELTTTP